MTSLSLISMAQSCVHITRCFFNSPVQLCHSVCEIIKHCAGSHPSHPKSSPVMIGHQCRASARRSVYQHASCLYCLLLTLTVDAYWQLFHHPNVNIEDVSIQSSSLMFQQATLLELSFCVTHQVRQQSKIQDVQREKIISGWKCFLFAIMFICGCGDGATDQYQVSAKCCCSCKHQSHHL